MELDPNFCILKFGFLKACLVDYGTPSSARARLGDWFRTSMTSNGQKLTILLHFEVFLYQEVFIFSGDGPKI